MDTDRSGTVSSAEAQAYADVVLHAIGLEIDGQPLHLELSDRRFPVTDAVRSGDGPIRLKLGADMPSLGAGSHSLRYQNRHRPDSAVYLANVLVPASDRVAMSALRRDVDQPELTVDFGLRGERGPGLHSSFLPAVAVVMAAIAVLAWRRTFAT